MPKKSRAPKPRTVAPRVRRREKTARAAVRKDSTLLEFNPPRREIPGVLKRKFEKR
jgi:hypothetical protein